MRGGAGSCYTILRPARLLPSSLASRRLPLYPLPTEFPAPSAPLCSKAPTALAPSAPPFAAPRPPPLHSPLAHDVAHFDERARAQCCQHLLVSAAAAAHQQLATGGRAKGGEAGSRARGGGVRGPRWWRRSCRAHASPVQPAMLPSKARPPKLAQGTAEPLSSRTAQVPSAASALPGASGAPLRAPVQPSQTPTTVGIPRVMAGLPAAGEAQAILPPQCSRDPLASRQDE